MNAQHTPGPWSVEIDHHNNAPEFIRAYADGEMYDLASVLCDETGNASANARLMAFAPELLAALQNIVACFDANDPDSMANAAADARAAIAKATGGAA